ncbi:sulfite exporter TauE/SafE family protein [Pinirhizobacter soli]|uniref:sulfite exporter TauE/SafE family protein n=1 Tax=Pinirhizobacter soli TaxID=2786953 RepID=UPI00202A8AAB|nr:sulfite exporter TauE/SafE family protein [Pinirhizobacter soli]
MLAIVFAAAFAAFVVSAFSGGGAGLLLLPLLALVVPVSSVAATLSIGSTISSVSRIGFFRRHIRWDVVRWFLPTAFPGAWLGAWLLFLVDLAWLQLIMGLYMVANLKLVLRPTVPLPGDIPSRPRSLLAVGLAVGFVSGLTGAVGLLFNRFYLQHGLAKEEVVATRAANEIALHVLKLGLYSTYGLLNTRAVGAGVLVGVAAVCAAWVSRGLLKQVNESTFRLTGYLAMVACGLFMVGKATVELLDRRSIDVTASVGRCR